MITNRFFSLLVVMALVLVASLTVREGVATSTVLSDIEKAQAADAARWTAMGEYYANQADAQHKEAPPYIMDSATRSYIAWGEALEAAAKLGDSGVCSTTSHENIFAGIPNNLDSATRSYIAWGLASQAKNDIEALCR